MHSLIKVIGIGLLLNTAVSAMAQQVPTENERIKDQKRDARNAQIDAMIRQEESGALIYNRQNLFGIKVYNQGWGLMYEHGVFKTPRKSNLFSIELGQRKHAKEQKLSTIDQGGFALGNPIIYGKQNSLYALKLGVGQSLLLGGKGNRNGVAVSAVYKGGINVAAQVPYYLQVRTGSGDIRTVKYESADSIYFLDGNSIINGAGIFVGFNELKIKPGLFLNGALRFDYGRYNELVSALEAGINVDYYFSKIPLMVRNPAQNFFLGIYAAIEFGNRKR